MQRFSPFLVRMVGRSRGFTLVELMVAVGLFAMLMLLVNQLFNQTTRAVTTGISAGDLTVTAEMLNNTFHRDAREMMAPHPTDPAGFLVIINRRIGMDSDPINPDDPHVLMPDPNHRGGTVPAFVRSDQLLFVRKFTGSSLTPRSNLHWSPATSLESDHSVVWYGHAAAVDDSGDLVPDSFGLGSRAWTWPLARHNLILAKAAPGGSNITSSFQMDQNTSGPFTAERRHGMTDIYWSGSTTPSPLEALMTFLDPGTYKEQAAHLMAADLGNPFRVNVTPQPGEVRQVAQTHGLLAQNVSDFIVEFAGGNGDDLDRYDSSVPELGGGIRWYSAFERNERTELFSTSPPPTSFGWSEMAGHYEHDRASDANQITHTFVFPHYADLAAGSRWPKLIRIRYRLHDRRGEVISSDPKVTSANGTVAGRWYETILPVAR